uniref:Hydroxyisourate hydrolase n=1 Tax=Mantoniella antarctica TaxID=81844 RepID=A0A7S0SIU0_9CHLO|mmetsp:Transcript_2655/g.6325  ORF Transcript_2655/g.6325 Transcript_2655/m.6325 type:complete len:324 (+) Transcript_2655:182-1153(+)
MSVNINAMSAADAGDAFVRCCGSPAFGALMAAARPFQSHGAMVAASRRIWHNECAMAEWKLAFEAHPRIGDVSQLREKFATTAQWCEGEQAAALESSNDKVLHELSEWNKRYEEKFGHIFIICASGVPAHDILAALKERYPNSPYAENGLAAGEQQKITEIRLQKLDVAIKAETDDADASSRRVGALGAHLAGSNMAAPPPAPPPARSPITTHVLDTTRGRPAEFIPITLETVQLADGSKWSVTGVTDKDGRVGTLLPPDHVLQPGHYCITFDVDAYLRRTTGTAGFYPRVPIHFTVKPSQVREHYHVPLLLNPFGYGTYRGS